MRADHTASRDLWAPPGITFAYVALIALLVGVTEYYADLSSRYRFVDDVQTHIFWTYRFQDHELFPQDIYADYYSTIMAPAGFRALYFVAAQVVDPLLFSKLLPFALLATMVVYIWRLGRVLEPRWGGVLAALLILEYAGNCRGGLPRSFFLALLVPHVYYLATRQFTKASAVLAAQGLFEPILFCLGFGLQGASLVRELAGRRAESLSSNLEGLRRPLVWFFAATILVGAIISSTHVFYRPRFVGPPVSRSEAAQMRDFQPGGREPFFDSDPVRFYLRSDSSGIGLNARLEKLLVGVAVLMLLLGRRFFQAPPIIVDIVTVSLVLFVLSHLVFPQLYLPNRYVRYTLPLAAILLIAFHTRQAVERVRGWLPEWPWPRGRRVWGTAAAGLLLLVVLIGAVRTVFVRVHRSDAAASGLYDFLTTLPKASVTGGTVKELDAVPLLAHRKIFWHAEFHAPFFKGYYQEVQRRYGALQQLEARHFSDVDAFCTAFGVTHFVFDRSQTLPSVVAERRPLFENARFLVTRCGPLAPGMQHQEEALRKT